MTSINYEISSESQQFSRITFITAILFLTVGSISVVLGLLFNSPIADALGILIGGLLLPLSFYSHYEARRGNLDRAVATEVLELLCDLNRELGKTVVMVTHDQRAAGYATLAMQLDKGRFVDMALTAE